MSISDKRPPYIDVIKFINSDDKVIFPQKTNYRNNGISIIRMIATIFIVVCHILQGYGNVLAFYFNIGVPIFLGISGWLYGSVEKKSVLDFYHSRFKKVIVPYYLFIVFLLAIYIMTKVPFTFKQIASMFLCQQAFGLTLPKCGHLWFITIIVICYFMTPLLLDLRDELYTKRGPIFFVAFFFTFSIFISMICLLNGFPTYIIYTMVYILGFGLSASKIYNYRIENINQKIDMGGLLFVAFILGISGFVMLYFLQDRGLHLPGIVFHLYKIGLAIVSVVYFSIWNFTCLPKWLNQILTFFDNYSYPIYLCHHIWILGTLSVLYLTNYLYLNVALSIILVVVSSIIFKRILRVLIFL